MAAAGVRAVVDGLAGVTAAEIVREVVDRTVVAGATGGVATAIGALSTRGRLLQSGLTRSYALYMLLGAAAIIAALLAGGAL